MSKNHKIQGLKFLILLTVSVLMISPATAGQPDEMTLDFTIQSALHPDVTHVKFECSLEGWTGDNIDRVPVAKGTVIAPKPTPGADTIITVNFEPIVDIFDLERSANYVCNMFVRNTEGEDQSWAVVSSAEGTPDIAHVEPGLGDVTSSVTGRAITFRGSLRGHN